MNLCLFLSPQTWFVLLVSLIVSLHSGMHMVECHASPPPFTSSHHTSVLTGKKTIRWNFHGNIVQPIWVEITLDDVSARNGSE